MTESDAGPVPGRDLPADPRRLVLADLVARLAAGLATRARDYEAAAGQEGALRRPLQELARAKHAQLADLAPLCDALGAPRSALPTPALASPPLAWGVILGKAFQAERDLEGLGRELGGLAADPAIKALAARLAAGADRDGREVRRLYLRYT
ncbi:MAG TPA: hypothetical protein VHO73_11020 [Methylomirabilota bacterium]|jgi:hypothetical protein|nr:hypothetical protein [Methylomirabilota bacterium]